MLQVMIVGKGARESALAWHLEKSPVVRDVFFAPADISLETTQELAKGVDLVIIGPEQPLADGLADQIRSVCTPVFGPNAAASKLESSKVYAREFMRRSGVSCPKYKILEPHNKIPKLMNSRVVIKADGLAGGKGVWICDTQAEAEAAIAKARSMGDGRCLIEERIYGREYSFYTIFDGTRHAILPVCRDYKREFDNDEGQNTGGMGAICPAPGFPRTKVLSSVVNPTLEGLKKENIFYRGVIYFGLIIDDFGEIYCLEYNVRFGDPETQALVRALDDQDLAPILLAAANGSMAVNQVLEAKTKAICVTLASEDYPREPIRDQDIHGLIDAACIDDVVLFEGAMECIEDKFSSKYLTRGGRVLSVTAASENEKTARDTVYEAVGKINFNGKKFRTDIGGKNG